MDLALNVKVNDPFLFNLIRFLIDLGSPQNSSDSVFGMRYISENLQANVLRGDALQNSVHINYWDSPNSFALGSYNFLNITTKIKIGREDHSLVDKGHGNNVVEKHCPII